MKNNLEHSSLPTGEEIRLYQEGKLDPVRSHQIELIAEENPLLGDAIEGYAASPAYNMLPGISAAITHTVATSAAVSTTSGVAAAAKIATPWWHLNGWLIGVVAGSGVAIGVYSLTEHSVNIASASPQQTTINQSAEITNNIDGQVIPEEKTEVVLSGEDAKGESNGVINLEEPKNVKNPIEAPTEVRNSGSDPSEIESKGLSSRLLLQSNAKAEDIPIVDKTEIKSSSMVAIQIMHVLNYKMADYTVIRKKEWENFSLDDLGVSAQYSSSDEKEKALKEERPLLIPYVQYASQCIKAFDESKFGLAIDRFATILNQYPDDVNAQFYTAMSYYELKEFDKAISLFVKVEKNGINTFDEESMFYHAKSLKALERLDEANSFFIKVVQQNGFYRERALEEMQ